MYRVIVYDNVNDHVGRVVHEPNSYGNKVISGKIHQLLNGISDFEFKIGISNTNYQKFTPLVNLVKVINEITGKVEFYGRVAEPTAGMDSDGLFQQTIYCESLLCYLHDSVQTYRKVQNTTIKDFFKMMIDRHNAQVESHKRFKLGNVTVENSTDNVYRYIGYESTFDTIKDKLIDRLGGYLILREETDGFYLDYLKEYGKEVNSPIQIASNLQSAEREVDISELATRIVPLGADLETSNDDDDHSQDASRPRLTITSVNNGVEWLEDKELVEKFGIIQKAVNWNDVHVPAILKSKGENYLKDQRTFLTSWTISAVEIGLLDMRYEDFTLGNKYPIILPQVADTEVLQVIEKEIDILKPQKSNLTIGNGKQTLSSLQLEGREQGQIVQSLQRNTVVLNKNVQRVDSSLQDVSKTVSAVSGEVSKSFEELASVKQEQGSLSKNIIQINQELTKKIEDLEKKLKELEER